jgi:predicted nucleotidyltransferase
MTKVLIQALSEFKSDMGTLYGDKLYRVELFGSHARGDAEDDSDVDILVVLKGPVRPYDEIEKTGEIVSRISLKYDCVISCVFMDAERFATRNGPLLRNIRREGVSV